jgi:hypothetical protein
MKEIYQFKSREEESLEQMPIFNYIAVLYQYNFITLDYYLFLLDALFKKIRTIEVEVSLNDVRKHLLLFYKKDSIKAAEDFMNSPYFDPEKIKYRIRFERAEKKATTIFQEVIKLNKDFFKQYEI